MKKVITYGTYDLITPGHIQHLKEAKEMGDYLIVGLSTDEFNKLKSKKSYFSYEFVRKIESKSSCRNTFSLATVDKLAKTLEVDVRLLFEPLE